MGKQQNLKADITNVMKRLGKVLSKVEGEEKKKILEKIAKPVVAKAQGLAPLGTPRGGVLKSAVSATYSGGKIKARYFKFNLRRSIQILNLKKTNKVVIGPVIRNKSTRKNFGKTDKSTDAFYAQMIFGSALAFGRRVTGAALDSNRSSLIKSIETEINRRVKKEAVKQKLN